MKKLRLFSLGLFAALLCVVLFVVGCSTDELRDTPAKASQVITTNPDTERIGSASACGAYTINLESITQVGTNYEWVWSIQNNNPGNGNGDTYQDGSHWGMQFGSCVSWSSIVGAAYSANGSNWTSFTPSYTADLSQDCLNTPVLKFDFGTNDDDLSYYKLIVNTSYEVGSQFGYYKSGHRTGCCTFNFLGIGCPGPQGE